ncbi:uncharacterized protein LOC120769997 [Bactrocera tryoni]|uniref:uncharacterized protein LOC120769997 n=1 Tax=Bactrocera tryoni TaxID=59916 RepID=UPI001A978A12|nr:uncharacterized protein LOC120769997 [Bactrocera tryoni]
MFRLIILFNALLILHCRGEYSDTVRLVNDLGQNLGVSTNVIFAFGAAEHFATIAKDLTLPKIIITTNITYEIKHNFDRKILNVVFLADTPILLDQSWHNVVFSALKRLHHTEVLFHWPHEFPPMTDVWLELFTLYWQHGFHNVLVVDVRAQLLSLEPFPELRVVNTTLKAYLHQRNNMWHDLKCHHLRISYIDDPPTTLIFRHPETREWQFDGFTAQIFAAFAQRHNLTIEPWIAQSSNDANKDHICLERLRKRLVDACSDGTSFKVETVTSAPMALHNFYLVVRSAPPLSKLYYFQVPFQPAAWQAIGASICLVIVVTTLLTRLQDGGWHFGRLGLDVWASFLYLGFDLRPMQSRSMRTLMFLTLFIGGFMLCNFYLGYLSSILGKSVYEPQIRTLQDFERSNIMLNEIQYMTLKRYGAAAIVIDRSRIARWEELLKNRNTFDTRYAYLYPDTTYKLLAYQQKFLEYPIMQKLDEPILKVLLAHAFKDDWPLEELFNKHSLDMFDTGLYLRYLMEGNYKSIRLGHVNYAATEGPRVAPLGLEYIAMPALILGFGFGLGFITLLLELLFYKMKQIRVNKAKKAPTHTA